MNSASPKESCRRLQFLMIELRLCLITLHRGILDASSVGKIQDAWERLESFRDRVGLFTQLPKSP